MKQTISGFRYQSHYVLAEYCEYCENKIDVGEVPKYFSEWAAIEIENNSPVSRMIELEQEED